MSLKASNPKSRPAAAQAAGGVAAVDRAFTILAAFGPDDRNLSLAELAARTGLHKSTILRLMESMQRHEYLLRLDNGRYQIGPMPFLLGAIYQRSLSLSDIVMPLLAGLSKLTGESITFFVPHGDQRVCLHRIDSRHEIREHLRAGDTFPLTRGSPGAVLTAFAGGRGERFDQIRSDYYFISYPDRPAEPVGISAPVFGTAQILLGSITISGPSTRISLESLERMRGPLLRAAAQATRALGGDAAPLENSAMQIDGDDIGVRAAGSRRRG
ncbi:MAG: IclR family transcriptional regulator [Lautropia sp.]